METVNRETMIRVATGFYRLPECLAKELLNKISPRRTTWFERVFKGCGEHVYTERISNEYYDLVKILSGAYHNDPLMGRCIPLNDPLAIEVHEYLNSKGVAIQYTSAMGMVLIQKIK